MDMMGQNTPADPAAPVQPPEDANGKKGFLSTTAGKAVLIVGAVVLLLSALGVVGMLLLGYLFTSSVEDAIESQGQVPVTDQSAAPATGEPEDVIQEPSDVPLNEIFSFRDIFDPLVEPLPPDDGSDTGTGTDVDGDTDGDADADVSTDTLYLQDITSEDGIPIAVLELNGETYRLEEGQSIPDTPWQVLSIGTSSVVMLYGDTQVTLSIGQGIAK
jgi:hypothetical protein